LVCPGPRTPRPTGRPAFRESRSRSRRLTTSTTPIATGSNPELQPYNSDNFDLSFEFFGKRASYLQVALFHKKVENFVLELGETINGIRRLPWASVDAWRDLYALHVLPIGATRPTVALRSPGGIGSSTPAGAVQRPLCGRIGHVHRLRWRVCRSSRGEAPQSRGLGVVVLRRDRVTRRTGRRSCSRTSLPRLPIWKGWSPLTSRTGESRLPAGLGRRLAGARKKYLGTSKPATGSPATCAPTATSPTFWNTPMRRTSPRLPTVTRRTVTGIKCGSALASVVPSSLAFG
jgi:hypothetical protein